MAAREYGLASSRNYRFYIVVDTSGSMDNQKRYTRTVDGVEQEMSTPMSRLHEALPAMLFKLLRTPTLNGRTWVSVITFGTEPKVVLPSISTEEFTGLDDLVAGGVTDYAKAFQALNNLIREDDENLPLRPGRHWWKPAIFFLTDGSPTLGRTNPQPVSDWKPARDAVVDDHDANIVALGFGDADEGTIATLATTTSGTTLAFIDEGSLMPAELISSISTSILRSIVRSTVTSILDVPLPDGMRFAKP